MIFLVLIVYQFCVEYFLSVQCFIIFIFGYDNKGLHSQFVLVEGTTD